MRHDVKSYRKSNALIGIGFLVALAVLLSFVYRSQGHIAHWRALQERESYTFGLIRAMDGLVYGLKDVRRNQRGYSRTGKEEYLKAYHEARGGVERHLAGLYRLAAGHPELQGWLGQIEPLVRAKLAQRQEELSSPPTQSPPAARVSTEQIEKRIVAIQDQAIGQLRESAAREGAEIFKLQRLLLAKALLLFLLMGLVFVLLRRDLARRLRGERELIEHRDRLDQLVQTRTRELEQANRRAEEVRRELNQHLDLVREEERLAISREVHDGIGQCLTALQLDLSWLERRCHPEPAEIGARFAEMHASLEELIGKVQHITAELRPPLLDNLGLPAALEWQAREWARRSGIECHLMLNEGVEVANRQAATNMLRIFQEALANIARHAGSSEVCVSLCERADSVVLEISDDGRGISREALASNTAYGIMGMRERARLCRGELNIKGEPGLGTTVTLEIPRGALQEET